MEVAPLLRDLVVLLMAALPPVYVCNRLGLPALCGFLLTGVVIGPSAVGIIHSPERVQVLAELGVVLLLFTIGLEFSLDRLQKMAKQMAASGGVQMAVAGGIGWAAAVAAGYDMRQATLFAFMLALSSTAVVLTLLEARGELHAPHGRLSFAVLLFQDLAVLPIMLLVPILSQPKGALLSSVIGRIALAAVVIAVVFSVARFALPLLLRRVLALNSRELFIGTVVVACFGTAWMTSQLGLSLAMGAFLAGLLVSESEYSHQVVAEILPLRDLFSSVFFVSIGMLLDVGFVASNPLMIAGLAAFVMVTKAFSGVVAVMPFYSSPRIATLVGVALCQVGEFSFVIAHEAHALGGLDDVAMQVLLATSTTTMFLSPLLLNAAGAVLHSRDLPWAAPEEIPSDGLPEHGTVIVVGYGLNGRNLTNVLEQSGVRYRIVDLDPDAVSEAREAGRPIIYGDATRKVVLSHLHVEEAAAVVVTIADPAATRRIVAVARALNPSAAVVVRTRHVSEIEDLYQLGATEVVPEEFETSVELFARVLNCLAVPANVIAAQVDVIRSEHYAMLRGDAQSHRYLDTLYELFTAATTVTHLIRKGSPAASRTLAELDLRGSTGATLVAAVRKGNAMPNPSDDLIVEVGDIFVLLGSHAQLAEARRLLEPAGIEGEARGADVQSDGA